MAIEIVNVSKAYERPVLQGFSAVFDTGTTAIMGASGAGKTTLAHIIAGLVRPDSGEVRGTAGKCFSFVFQEDRLLTSESALTNINFPLKSPSPIAEKLLRDAGLGEDMHIPARDLSGGMRRRVSICRALAVQYDILILDEPLKGLNIGLKEQILGLIKDNTHGKSVIYITHDPTEADFLGARVLEINPI
jgi:NitT/TauT family transport system ATP-binding protein